MPQFFVSCPPGFEKDLLAEMQEFWLELSDLDGLPTRTAFPDEYEMITGGIELVVPEHLGFQINFFSKIAGRVLLRIAKFEARYYDRLEKEIAKVPVKNIIGAGSDRLQIKVETHKSRLNNEKNIIEAVSNALAIKPSRGDEPSAQTLYIRIEKDRAVVSLDTSGDHLHRRGYAVYRGEAPLRETLAALMVRRLSQFAQMDTSTVLIDPFAGSGTLLFEALSRNVPLFQRQFAWQSWQKIPKFFLSPTWIKNYRWIQKVNRISALGFDIDAKSVLNAEKNKTEFLQKFQIEGALHAAFYQRDSQTLNKSLISEYLSQLHGGAKADHLKDKKIWLIANPPYGERLSDPDQAALRVLHSLEESVHGMLVLHPLHWKFSFSELQLVQSEDFKNQGLALKLSVFTRKN